MKFRTEPVHEAKGGWLAHSHSLADGRKLTKGTLLTQPDVEALYQSGLQTVTVARLEVGDVYENEAANRLAAALIGSNLQATHAHTGRVNFTASRAGLFMPNIAAVNAFNSTDCALTLATLAPAVPVQAHDIVATLKIIPFGVPETLIIDFESLNLPRMALHPWQHHKVCLIQTQLAHTSEKVLHKTSQTLLQRLKHLDSTLIEERQCKHSTKALVSTLKTTVPDADLIVISGASAIVDASDIIPEALQQAGYKIIHYGMPVDPGNLLIVGKHVETGSYGVGMPGCARSIARNGFDLVLERICAGLEITATSIQGMGVGGLLKDTPTRPLPRAEAPHARQKQKVSAILLAAGLSRRMGTENKLLKKTNGLPLVLHAAQALAQSKVEDIIAVLGHEADAVEAALSNIAQLRCIVAPNYAAGIAHSLKAGLAALSQDADGALICLGDMPFVSSDIFNDLIAAFDPVAGRSIVAPIYNGQRGNPVLWGRRFFADMSELSGDEGARKLLLSHHELLFELDVNTPHVVTDMDCPKDFESL